MKKITKITPDLIGKKVRVRITDIYMKETGKVIEEAMIVVVEGGCGLFGLAQNVMSGSNPEVEQRHDYKYVFTFRNDSLGKNLELYLKDNNCYIPFL